MNDPVGDPEPRSDVLVAMHALAAKGATVRELVAEIQARLGCKEDEILPVLWYFIKAFSLRLSDVLPVRDWLVGAVTDEEIDSLILPRIGNARGKWLRSSNGLADQMAAEAVGEDHSREIAEQR